MPIYKEPLINFDITRIKYNYLDKPFEILNSNIYDKNISLFTVCNYGVLFKSLNKDPFFKSKFITKLLW